METNANYLESVIKLFSYYKALAEKAIDQLEPDQLFVTANEDSNSIAVIMKHLAGNMRSRWTDFLTSDGEKQWRNRDGEFIEEPQEKSALMSDWESGWKCLFEALENLSPEQLDQIVYIRNEGHIAADAINRQLAHYPYHVGQIVFYAKMLKNGGWNSLSIPRNTSASYNKDKFSKEKSVRHFTDSEIGDRNAKEERQ
ncbi:MAG: DUF1572 domain-containing protein [Flavobacterium sp.]|nr:MAG: DUF1572 domain-containing protein [Flavobacterium sp.]